jgi:hypothetical protein
MIRSIHSLPHGGYDSPRRLPKGGRTETAIVHFFFVKQSGNLPGAAILEKKSFFFPI